MMNTVKSLSHEDAWAMLTAIKKRLEDEKQGAAITVVDDHGELIAFFRTEGCPLSSINNARNKAYTAAREGKPTMTFAQEIKADGHDLLSFRDAQYTAFGGGVPVIFEGRAVGAVGVSGLTQEEDIALAEFGIGILGLEE